ncbi:MAG: decaprenyl-phosphate phosphoribosyltransferase [candidate division FCPU426 bacterium]
MIDIVGATLELLRPRQWPKNLLLFAALVFSGAFMDLASDLRALQALAAFLLLSSSVYAFNDIHDLESDRHHPVKKNRPLASGRLGVPAGWAICVVSLALGLALASVIGRGFFYAAAGYVISSTAYTLVFKHHVILDVFFVASGFVLRAVAGALAINARISPWLLVCTSLLALFLALSKRRAEITLLKDGAGSHRRALEEYSPALLDQMISVVASATVVAYSLYAFLEHNASGSPWMMLTVPFVLYGIFRYLYLSHKKGLAGAPELILLRDLPMQLNILLWVTTAAIILHMGGI